jgi:hypothetical protein
MGDRAWTVMLRRFRVAFDCDAEYVGDRSGSSVANRVAVGKQRLPDLCFKTCGSDDNAGYDCSLSVMTQITTNRPYMPTPLMLPTVPQAGKRLI